jgi:hypothetical protein
LLRAIRKIYMLRYGVEYLRSTFTYQ